MEKLYAGAHGYSVGDRLSIEGEMFTVSGTGSSPDYDSPLQNLTDVASDKHRFGTAFVNGEGYRRLRDGGRGIQSETYLYAYRLSGGATHEELKEILKSFHIDRDAVSDRYFLELLNEAEGPKNELLEGVAALVEGGVSLNEALNALEASGGELATALGSLGLPPQAAGAAQQYLAGAGAASDGAAELLHGLYELQEKAGELAEEFFAYDIENLTSLLQAENNPRIAASVEDVAINRAGGILAGVIVLVLFAYVISVFTVHTIDGDSEVIGTLYALGVPRGALLHHYLALPVAVSALGGIGGTLLGFSPLGVACQIQDTAGYFSYPAPGAQYRPTFWHTALWYRRWWPLPLTGWSSAAVWQSRPWPCCARSTPRQRLAGRPSKTWVLSACSACGRYGGKSGPHLRCAAGCSSPCCCSCWG